MDVIHSETPTAPSAPLMVGDKLPKALGPVDMQRAFNISAPTFRKRKSLGEFRPFELPRAIGIKRWSGEKVQAFLNGRK